jgi:hypothetical protein
MAGEVIPTQEEFLKKVQEWSDKKGRKPNTVEARQIWADMLAEGTTLTDEERARQEKIEKQELTDAGLNSLAAQLVGQSQQAMPAVTEQPAIVRPVAADSKNLLDPLTGKAIKGIDRGTTTGTYNYSGMNLVDENGYITQSSVTDLGEATANVLFQEMNVKGTLPKTLLALKASGHYYGKSPSQMALSGQGMTSTDYAAWNSFINSANLARYTPKGYLAKIEKNPGAFSVEGGSGSGSSIAYPNEMDISRTLRNESFAALGRPMTPAEIRVAINFVKQSYASAGGAGGEQAPSLQAAAETAVAKTSGEEGAVYSLGMALDRMFAGQGSV